MKFTIETKSKTVTLLEKATFREYEQIKKFIGENWREWSIEPETVKEYNNWWWGISPYVPYVPYIPIHPIYPVTINASTDIFLCDTNALNGNATKSSNCLEYKIEN